MHEEYFEVKQKNRKKHNILFDIHLVCLLYAAAFCVAMTICRLLNQWKFSCMLFEFHLRVKTSSIFLSPLMNISLCCLSNFVRYNSFPVISSAFRFWTLIIFFLKKFWFSAYLICKCAHQLLLLIRVWLWY